MFSQTRFIFSSNYVVTVEQVKIIKGGNRKFESKVVKKTQLQTVMNEYQHGKINCTLTLLCSFYFSYVICILSYHIKICNY